LEEIKLPGKKGNWKLENRNWKLDNHDISAGDIPVSSF